MKQKILFVINTLGRAGAENALLSLLKLLDPAQYDISLYVTMGQGELRAQLPPWVQLKNPAFSTCSVLTAGGRRRMVQKRPLRLGKVRRVRLWISCFGG